MQARPDDNQRLVPRRDREHVTDDQLMVRLRTGRCEPALVELRRRYGIQVYRLVHGILRDTHLAEDAAALVFQKVYFKAAKYQPGTHFAAWLMEVARNQALSILRARKCLPRAASSLVHAEQDAEDDNWFDAARGHYEDHRAEERELMDRLETAIASLPDHYRQPFQLCVRDGLQYREAAEKLGIPTGTVAIRIMRARKRLFAALEGCLGPIRRPPACFSAA